MEAAGSGGVLDVHLPAPIRSYLEERFWRPIGAQATLELLAADPAFLEDPGRHPAMFADHGVVHVRDVAVGLVRLIDTIDGVLIPGRTADRLRFMQALGVATAYLHDIGMVDMTRTGRRVHALFAAHEAFGPSIGPLLDHLLGPGIVRERLHGVAASAPFATSLEVVVREMLSLSMVHSKTTVPPAVLDDRVALRRLLQRVVFTSLDEHRAADHSPVPGGEDVSAFVVNTSAYDDPSRSFAWLVADGGPQAELADDLVDVARALRAADVLRQRGSTLRTSGGFEVCMDARTARAVCTLRPATGDAAYVVTYDDERGAGEANIREAIVTPRGHLRIAFHRGAFGTSEAAERAASSVAGVVIDVQADVIPSFGGGTVGGGLRARSRPVEEIQIQLERPDDRPEFADEVAALVAAAEPSLRRRLVTVADTESAAPEERDRFHRADPVDAHGPLAHELLEQLAERGARTEGIDRAAAFVEVCRARIRSGEVLVARGSPPSFVYVPTGPGLVVRPDGGYKPAPLPPWVPVGTTGVIRRAERNSDVLAEQEVEVFMIPGELYARAWLRPLDVHQLAARLRSPVPSP